MTEASTAADRLAQAILGAVERYHEEGGGGVHVVVAPFGGADAGVLLAAFRGLSSPLSVDGSRGQTHLYADGAIDTTSIWLGSVLDGGASMVGFSAPKRPHAKGEPEEFERRQGVAS